MCTKPLAKMVYGVKGQGCPIASDGSWSQVPKYVTKIYF